MFLDRQGHSHQHCHCVLCSTRRTVVCSGLASPYDDDDDDDDDDNNSKVANRFKLQKIQKILNN